MIALGPGARRRLAVAAFCLAGLAFEVYMLAFRETSHVSAMGAHRVLVKEFGGGASVTQSFTMRAGGFDEIRILVWASDRSDVTFKWTLLEQRPPGTFSRLVEKQQTIYGLSNEAWETLSVPTIESSAGKVYRLDLRLVEARPQTSADRPEVALVASLEHPVRGGFLTVNGDERWGDLVFDTHATADTIFGRLRMLALPSWPGPLRNAWFVIALVVGYNLLLVACTVGLLPVAFSQKGEFGQAQPPEAAKATRPRWAAARGMLVLVLLAGGIFAAVHASPNANRRVNLIDELYTAELSSSPNTMHGTFEVVTESAGEETMPAVGAHTNSRIAWKVEVPARSRLQTALVINPGAWGRPPGDGVVFRIGALVNGRYQEMLDRHVDPVHVADDRRWIHVDLDLSAFAGQTIDLVFQTVASLPGQQSNYAYDWARWGDPRIVAQ